MKRGGGATVKNQWEPIANVGFGLLRQIAIFLQQPLISTGISALVFSLFSPFFFSLSSLATLFGFKKHTLVQKCVCTHRKRYKLFFPGAPSAPSHPSGDPYSPLLYLAPFTKTLKLLLATLPIVFARYLLPASLRTPQGAKHANIWLRPIFPVEFSVFFSLPTRFFFFGILLFPRHFIAFIFVTHICVGLFLDVYIYTYASTLWEPFRTFFFPLSLHHFPPFIFFCLIVYVNFFPPAIFRNMARKWEIFFAVESHANVN